MLENHTRELIMLKMDIEQQKSLVEDNSTEISNLKSEIKDILKFNDKVRDKIFDFEFEDGHFNQKKDTEESFGADKKDGVNLDRRFTNHDDLAQANLIKQIKDDIKKNKMDIIHLRNENGKKDVFMKDKLDTIMINLDNIKKKLNISSEGEESIYDAKINELRNFVLQKMGEYDKIVEEEMSVEKVEEKSFHEEVEKEKSENNDIKKVVDNSQSNNNSEMAKRVLIVEKGFKLMKSQLADFIKNKVNVSDFNQVKDNISKYLLINTSYLNILT